MGLCRAPASPAPFRGALPAGSPGARPGPRRGRPSPARWLRGRGGSGQGAGLLPQPLLPRLGAPPPRASRPSLGRKETAGKLLSVGISTLLPPRPPKKDPTSAPAH